MKSIGQSQSLRRVTKAPTELPPHELTNAEKRRLQYRQQLQISDADAQLLSGEAVEQARLQQIKNTPAQQLTWVQMSELSRVSPDLAAEKWGQVKGTALEELRSGHRAAKAVEGLNSNPLERARFLVLLDELREQYQPSSGIEDLLLQNLAQAQTEYEKWLTTLNRLTALHCNTRNEEINEWTPPRISEAETIAMASEMVEKFHRLFVRSLRALKELRRVSAAVIVGNQVNVADKQVINPTTA